MEYMILIGCIIIILILIMLVTNKKEKRIKPIDLEKIEKQESNLEIVLKSLEGCEATERQLTSYEQEQEDTAIISYQELVKAVEEKKKNMSEEDKNIMKNNKALTEEKKVQVITEELEKEYIEAITNQEEFINDTIEYNINSIEKNDLFETINEETPQINNYQENNVLNNYQEQSITSNYQEQNILNNYPEENIIKNEPLTIEVEEPIEKKRFKNSEFISPIFGKDKQDEEFLKELKDFRSNL